MFRDFTLQLVREREGGRERGERRDDKMHGVCVCVDSAIGSNNTNSK